MPGRDISESYGSCLFSLVKNLLTVLHAGCSNLHSHQQFKRVLFAPHTFRPLLLVHFLIMVIWTGVSWYLIIVLISISLIIRGASGGSDGKASAYNAGDPGSIPGLGRSPGEGNGYPFQCSCLENPMDGGAWWATVHGIAESGIFSCVCWPAVCLFQRNAYLHLLPMFGLSSCLDF